MGPLQALTCIGLDAELERGDHPLPLCDAAFTRLGSSEAPVGPYHAENDNGADTPAALPLQSGSGILETMPQLRPLRLGRLAVNAAGANSTASRAPSSAHAVLQASSNVAGKP